MTDVALGLAVNIAGNAMRFYKGNGWSREILVPYLLKGHLIYHEDDMKSYWMLGKDSELDVETMISSGAVGHVEGKKFYKDTLGLTDLEALKLRNVGYQAA